MSLVPGFQEGGEAPPEDDIYEEYRKAKPEDIFEEYKQAEPEDIYKEYRQAKPEGVFEEYQQAKPPDLHEEGKQIAPIEERKPYAPAVLQEDFLVVPEKKPLSLMVPVEEIVTFDELEGMKIRGAPSVLRDIEKARVEELKPGSPEWRKIRFDEKLKNNASRTRLLELARLTLERLQLEPTDIKAKTVYEQATKRPEKLMDYAPSLAYAVRESKTMYGRTKLALAGLHKIIQDAEGPSETASEAKDIFDAIVESLKEKAEIWSLANKPMAEDLEIPSLIRTSNVAEQPLEDLRKYTDKEIIAADKRRLEWARQSFGKQDPFYGILPRDQWSYLATTFDVVDVPIKTIMRVWMGLDPVSVVAGESGEDERSPTWGRLPTIARRWNESEFEFLSDAAPGHGQIGGKHLSWEARHEFIRTKAKQGSIPARMLVTLGRSIGKYAGASAAGWAMVIGELYDDTVKDQEFEDKYGIKPRHMMYDEYRDKAPKEAKKEYDRRYGTGHHWGGTYRSTLDTLFAWQDGVSDLVMDIAVDPLTWVGATKGSAKEALKHFDNLLKEGRPVYDDVLNEAGAVVGRKVVGREAFTDSARASIMAEAEEAVMLANLVGEAYTGPTGAVKISGKVEKRLKIGRHAPKRTKVGEAWEVYEPLADPASEAYRARLLKATGRSEAQIAGAEQRYIRAVLDDMVTVGAKEELERATASLKRAKRTDELLKGGSESAATSKRSYADFELEANIAALEGDRTLLTAPGAVQSVLGAETKLRAGKFIPAYAEIAKTARRHGIPLADVRKLYGRGGVDLYRAETTFAGIRARIPGFGPHAVRRSIRKLGPTFFPHAKALEAAAGVMPKGKLFTYEGGEAERQARALASGLEEKGLSAMEQIFEAAPPQLIIDPEYRQWVFENHVSPAREVFSVEGILPRKLPMEEELGELRALLKKAKRPEAVERIKGAIEGLEQRLKGTQKEMLSVKAAETIEGAPIQRRTDQPYRGLSYVKKTKQARPVEIYGDEPGNITGQKTLGEALNAPGEELTITRIGLTEDAIKGSTELSVPFKYEEAGWIELRVVEAKIAKKMSELKDYPLKPVSRRKHKAKKGRFIGVKESKRRSGILKEINELEIEARQIRDGLDEPASGMEGAIKQIRKKAEKLNIEVSDDHKWAIEIAGRRADSGLRGVVHSDKWTENHLLSYRYSRPTLEDIGYRTPILDDKGRKIGSSFEGKHAPQISKDSKGNWYAIKQKLTGREDDFAMTEELRRFLTELEGVMPRFHDEYVKLGAIAEAQAGYDPLTRIYWPHDYTQRALLEFEEGLLSDSAFSAASTRHAKSKTEHWGIALGDREKLSELNIEPSFDATKVFASYNRGMSKKAARVQLELAVGERFGLKKSDFMELYKVESDGRGVKQIVADPRKGPHLIFDDKISIKDLAKISEDIFPDISVNIKVRPITQEMRYGKRKPRTYYFEDVDPSTAEELAKGKKAVKYPDKDRYIVQEVFRTPSAFRRTVDGKDVIYFDQDRILKNYHKKPWLTPKVKGVNPLDRGFRSPGEWLDFIVAHEKAHVKFRRNKLEPTAAYENRINGLAFEEIDRVYAVRDEAKGLRYDPDRPSKFSPRLSKEIETELRANKEWEKYRKQARNSNGEEIRGSPYKLMEDVNGREIILPAEQANWIRRIASDNSALSELPAYQEFMSAKTNTGAAFRAAREGLRATDRAFKRGILLATGGFHSINAITDSLMLMGHLGMYDLEGHYRMARQLLNDPANFKLKVTLGGTTKYISGVDILANARRNGIANNSIARMDYWAEGFKAEERLELAALRTNGRAFDIEYWKEALKAAGHADFQGVKAAAKKQWKATLPTRAKRRDFGIRQGEMLTAYWTDTTQLAGFLHEVKQGHSYSRAAQRSLAAVLDYGAKDRALNTVRLFAPFASWAVKSPKATIGAFRKRPGLYMVPVKWGQMEEDIAIKQEGENYYLPEWMQEMGNYRRQPKAYKKLASLGRMLLGGTPLSEEEQLYVRQRAVPLFESLGPWVSMGQMAWQMRPWFAAPIVQQLGPKWRALYEWGAERNLYTLDEEYGLALSRPFTEGTVLPGLGPLPSSKAKGVFPLLKTAPAGQGGWLSRHGAGAMGALPELFPGQRLLFSRPGFNLMNMAQYYSQDQTGPPVTWGAERRLTGPDQGANLLAQMIMGTLTGYTPTILDPAKQVSSAMNTRELKRLRLLQEDAYKRLRAHFEKIGKEILKEEKKPRSKARKGVTFSPGYQQKE